MRSYRSISLICKINLSKKKIFQLNIFYFVHEIMYIFNVCQCSLWINTDKTSKNSLSFVTRFSWTLYPYHLLILSNRICDAKATRIFESNSDFLRSFVRSIGKSGRCSLDATRTRCCSFKQRSPLWVAKETRSSGSTRIKEPLSSREEEFLDGSSSHWDTGDKIWRKPGCVPVSMITSVKFLAEIFWVSTSFGTGSVNIF